MVGWYFKPKTPGETIREPIHGEFFATDAISDPGMALVREGIQNSLDAGRAGEIVHVRLFASGERHAAAVRDVDRFFGAAREHLGAPGSGLHPEDVPDANVTCPFVVFEDFGTQGLEGDPSEPFRPKTSKANHFYYFFRAEGQTDKGASERGSWGVGKHVFWRSSRVSTVLAYTVRASDQKRLLMGKSVLKCHWVDDVHYQDGYYGTKAPATDGLVMPIHDETELESFRAAFQLRRTAEPGLSVVVPWPDPEITREALLKSVVRDYFYPILAEQLHVVVETPATRTSLDAASLIPEVRRLGGPLVDELEPVLELATWARALDAGERATLNMPSSSHAWKWDKALFPEALAKELQAKFERLERIAVRVPVTVRKKNAPPKESFYDVFMVRDVSDGRGRPTFIREGVIVPKVDAPRSRGVRALVIADDEALASFLRDAENPSHTEWQHDGSNFKGKYRSGASDLKFVKRSVHEIVRVLSETESKEDRALLADFFSLPGEMLRGRAKKPGEETGTEPPVGPDTRSTALAFRVQKIQGGFSVLPGDKSQHVPRILEIRAAYDVRRGNPLKKYRDSDFKFEASPIRFDPPPQGVEVLEYGENRLLIEVLNPKFSLHVSGFDSRRDLYVKVEPKEALLVDSTS
jgi:hypothetical protein